MEGATTDYPTPAAPAEKRPAPRPESGRFSEAEMSAVSSISAPRPMLLTIAPGGSIARRRASSSVRVSGVSGVVKTTTSAEGSSASSDSAPTTRSNPSGTPLPGLRRVPVTRAPSARKRRATSVPIPPAPTTSTRISSHLPDRSGVRSKNRRVPFSATLQHARDVERPQKIEDACHDVIGDRVAINSGRVRQRDIAREHFGKEQRRDAGRC